MIIRYGYKNEGLEDIEKEYSNPRKHPTRPPIGFYDEVEEARKDAVYYNTEKDKWDKYRDKTKPLIVKIEVDIHDRYSLESTIEVLNDALNKLEKIEKTKPTSNFNNILRNGYRFF